MTNTKAKLGFGTSGIMGAAFSDKGRLRLLEHCFESGIDHFDTAPIYGLGDAEKTLGKFLSNKRSQVVLASKFGLQPRPLQRVEKFLKPIGRYLNRRSTTVNSVIHGIQTLRTNTSIKSENQQADLRKIQPMELPYNPHNLEYELEESLRKLQTDYLDYYLFHEANENSLSEELVDKLDTFVKQGKILKYGIATGCQRSNEILKKMPHFNGVIQRPFQTPSIANLSNYAQPPIVHSLIRGNLYQRLTTYVNQHKDTIKMQMHKLDLHLNVELLPHYIVLCSALDQDPNATLLFSSKSESNISEFNEAFIFVCEKQKEISGKFDELLTRLELF